MSTVLEDGKELFTVYYRVSTKKQGKSGLGLEAQRTMAEDQIRLKQGVILAEYTEVETGTKHTCREELRKALEHCKLTGSTLVVASIDRLSRNVHFITSLMESGVKFFACDMPDANNLTIHIMAATAEDEAKRTSVRTKKALQAAKESGATLGSSNPKYQKTMSNKYSKKERDSWSKKASSVAAEKRAKEAKEFLSDVSGVLHELLNQNLSYAKMAEELNKRKIKSPSGKLWSKSTTHRLVSELLKR